ATYFQDRYSSFYLMAVSTEEHYRHQRLREQGLTDAEIKDIDAKEYRKSSLDEKSSYIYQNIQSCLEISDIYVENPEEENVVCRYSGLANQLIKFTSLMKRPGIITPSNVERCMQIAYTAKLNSGCISRQVGAAVSDSSFSIKSIGWNDVPSGQVPCSLRDRFDLSEGIDDIAYSEFEKNENSFIRKIDSTKIIFLDVKNKGMRAPF
ncbi:TPA: deoxycytidylate deaminase, partial [Escherichia coli]